MVARARYVLLMLLLFSLLVPIPYQPYTIPSVTNSQSSTLFIPSGEYIVPITIHTNLTSPVYNYSLEIVLNTTNFNGWSYINTSNIYFLDQNGHPLYYWIQELNTTGREAIIWVNTTLTNTTIYMLYGGYNPYPEYNNPNRVFLFYDDFEDSTKLTISTSGVSTYSYSTSYVIHGSYSLEYSETSTTSGGSVNGTAICYLGNSFMVQAWVRPAFSDPIKEQGIFLYISRYVRAGFQNPGATNSPEINIYVNGTLAESETVANWVQNEWYLMQVIYSNQHITIRIYFENGTLFTEYTSTNTYTLTNDAVGFFIETGAGQTGNAYIDLLTARKYIDPNNYTISIGTPYPVAEFMLPISISTSLSSPVYNYSLRLELNSTNVPDWSTVFINDNIFVLDSQGHPLYYWIESYNRTTESMVLWVNITLTDQTIYIYTLPHYNPYKSYNDPKKVFLWYDTQGNPSEYVISSITGTATWSQDTTNGNPAPSLKATYNSTGEEIAYPPNINLTDVVIEADVKGSTYSGNVQPAVAVRYIPGKQDLQFRLNAGAGTYSAGITYSDIASGTGGFLWTTTSFTLTTGVWYHVVGIAYGDKVRMIVYDQNGNLLADSGWVTTTYTSGGYAGAIYVSALSSSSIWWDNIRIYKYVDPSNYTISIEHPIVLFAQNVIPVTIHTKLSQPVYNYSLRLEFNTTNIQNWDYVFGSGNSTTIYVLDQNGNPLYYWAETYNTTAKDVVLWVNTTLTNETILVFTESFNNPYKIYNNPDRIFLFYDGFEGSTKWNLTTNAVLSTAYSHTGSYSVKFPGNTGNNEGISRTIVAEPIMVFDMWVYFTGDSQGHLFEFHNSAGTLVGPHVAIGETGTTGTGDGYIYYYTSSWISTNYYVSPNKWHHFEIIIDLNSQTFDLYVDGNLVINNAGFINGNTMSVGATYTMTTDVNGLKGTFPDWYVDDTYQRKYVDPSDYSISIGNALSTIIYSGYGSISPTSVYGVLSSINSYSYTVNFTVSVTNNGTVPQNYTLLVLNGNSVAVYNETVSVSAGDTYTSWFTYTFTSPVNTTWHYIVEANNTVYTNTTIPVTIVEVSGAYVPIHITYYGSQPVQNYTLMLNLTSNNFNGWGYIGGNTTIGFLDSNGNPLYYWIDYLNVTEEQAIIYVNITLTNTTIYMYINLNPNPLLRYDDPHHTFILYDDFTEKTDQWKWTSEWIVSDGCAKQTYSSGWSDALWYNGNLGVQVTNNVGVVIETYARNLGTVSAYDMQIIWDNDEDDSTYSFVSMAVGTYDKWDIWGSTTSTTNFNEPDERNWNTYKVILFNGEWILMINGKQYSSVNANINTLARIGFRSKGESLWDWVYVYRYVDPSTFTVEIGSLVGIAGVVFTGSITPTSVTVSIPSVNATAYQLFNMTVSNIGNTTSWAVMELVGDNNTVLYSNNVTLASGETYSAVYNATFTYSDHGIHTWYYIVKNDTKVFVNDTVTITVVINITLSFNYTQYFNQSILPSWVNSTWFNYTIDIPEPSALEKWIPSMWYNYTQTAEATLNGVTWIQANSIPRIIGTNACITLYTNTTGNWTQVYHVCNSYAYYLVVEIVLEPVGVPADYPNAYISILVWDNSINDYRYIYSIYVPSGNQSVLLFANQYYKLEIPASGTTIHGYSFVLDKYVLDGSVINPPTIYLNQSHVLTIYYRIVAQGTGTTTTAVGTTSPFDTVTVPVVPPSMNFNYTFNGTGLLPTNIGWGSPGLYTAKGILLTVFYLGIFIIFLRLYDWKTALLVSTSLGMIVAIIMFGTTLVPLFMVLLLVGVGLWKLKS